MCGCEPQGLASWGPKGKGFELVPQDGKLLKVSCSAPEAEEICTAMRERAIALGKRIKAQRKAEQAAALAAEQQEEDDEEQDESGSEEEVVVVEESSEEEEPEDGDDEDAERRRQFEADRAAAKAEREAKAAVSPRPPRWPAGVVLP